MHERRVRLLYNVGCGGSCVPGLRRRGRGDASVIHFIQLMSLGDDGTLFLGNSANYVYAVEDVPQRLQNVS